MLGAAGLRCKRGQRWHLICADPWSDAGTVLGNAATMTDVRRAGVYGRQNEKKALPQKCLFSCSLARPKRFERSTPAFGGYNQRLALTVDILSNIGEI